MVDDAETRSSSPGLSYGEHILSTGKGLIGRFELLLGRYFYEKYFLQHRIVLDLAPGRCWFTKQNPQRIHAVDRAPEIVEHYARQGLQITQGSAEEIPHPAGFFEAVFCCWLFEHLQDPDIAMREIYRVLEPGGLCFLVVPSDHQLTRGFWDDYTHVRPYTRSSLGQLALANGFTDPVAEPLPLTFLTSRLLPIVGEEATFRYLQFCDRTLRRVGIVNRNMLTLACTKRAA